MPTPLTTCSFAKNHASKSKIKSLQLTSKRTSYTNPRICKRIHNMGIFRQLLVDNDEYVGCMDPLENSHITKWRLQAGLPDASSSKDTLPSRSTSWYCKASCQHRCELEFPGGKATFSSRNIYKWWVF